MTNGNDPAFANSGIEAANSWAEHGLTKREYFAAMALQGISSYIDREDEIVKDAAALSVEMADALIEALNKQV